MAGQFILGLIALIVLAVLVVAAFYPIACVCKRADDRQIVGRRLSDLKIRIRGGRGSF